MQPYKNNGRFTGVVAFESGIDFIKVKFRDGSVYLYTNASAGQQTIKLMNTLAKAGKGLTTFINQHVKTNYAAKLA